MAQNEYSINLRWDARWIWKIFYQISKFGTKTGDNSQRFWTWSLKGKKFEDSFIGGKQIKEYLEEGIRDHDLESYKPLDFDIIKKKNIEFFF